MSTDTDFPILQAPAAIAKLLQLFPATYTVEDHKAFFTTFEDVCIAHKGLPFTGFPTFFGTKQTGMRYRQIVHVARFYRPGSLAAYAAVLLTPVTGKLVFTHDMDGPIWPTWLDTYLKGVEDKITDLRAKHSSYEPNSSLH